MEYISYIRGQELGLGFVVFTQSYDSELPLQKLKLRLVWLGMWGPTSLQMFYPMVRRRQIFAVNIDIPHQKISEAEELRIALDNMIVNDSHLFFEGSAGSGLISQCT